MKDNKLILTRRGFVVWTGAVAGAQLLPALAAEGTGISPQPYFAGVNRALESLTRLGAPIALQDARALASLARQGDRAAVDAAEAILDRYTVVRVVTEPDGYARVAAGGAPKTLVEQGWRAFLVRVANPIASTARLALESGSPSPIWGSTGASRAGIPDTDNPAILVERAWLKSEMDEAPPLGATLSGAFLEYRVVQLYSRDRGPRDTVLNGFTSAEDNLSRWWTAKQFPRGAHLHFECLPSHDIELKILDTDGIGCMAALTIKDGHGRVYPLQGMRLAPDMVFHAHIYRADGETVRLPDGEYTVESKRGPEYLRELQKVTMAEGRRRIEVKLKRWIDPARWGWYCGDPHIHAGGCAHYEHPTEGVSPETMIRHVRGEALFLGEVLSWGPSWYYQKQFFSGRTISPPASLEQPELQAANNASLKPRPTPKDADSLLRYDVEVAGFPSSAHGHLALLRLKEQDYPGTKLIQDWPSWNLPILKWAREQRAVAGYTHCGHGMVVDSKELPNYEIPPMDGIGTQEAIIDVAHGYCDFLAGCDTHPVAELNAWYHLLNCGFRLAMVGETDYPCVTGERPGMGRSYVRLDEKPKGDAGYEAWIQALKQGRLYCGDGRSHFLEFKVQGRSGGDDDVVMRVPGTVKVEALVAARLDPERDAQMEAYLASPILEISPTWHLERARIGKTRDVAVELIVNGEAVDRATVLADGTPRRLSFKTTLTRSSWVALRILPSAHTHPVFVEMLGKPIRASKRSAQWCRSCVDKLWEVKSPFIRTSERSAAAAAYEHARKTYDRIIRECEAA